MYIYHLGKCLPSTYCGPGPEVGSGETKIVMETLMWRNHWPRTCPVSRVFMRWYIKGNNGGRGKLWRGPARPAKARCKWAVKGPWNWYPEAWRVRRSEPGEEGGRHFREKRKEHVSELVEVPCVASAELYNHTVWLGLKLAKQGGLKIRVETYMESRWHRVWTIPTGNKKPLMVLSRGW